ncbi:YnbE family lipoprotein [Roseospira marina]|uniref:YnbE family lipoprotein n=1 Tax=Roseospira marina TaxID=140057 RepID=A0A5M6IAP3_9PROT|nr:YnbE family lipoprotein [Roseospira marina]
MGPAPTGLSRRAPPVARRLALGLTPGLILGLILGACQPTVKVEAPDKPIVINLNVKIEQDVRVRLEKDVEDVLDERPDIF